MQNKLFVLLLIPVLLLTLICYSSFAKADIVLEETQTSVILNDDDITEPQTKPVVIKPDIQSTDNVVCDETKQPLEPEETVPATQPKDDPVIKEPVYTEAPTYPVVSDTAPTTPAVTEPDPTQPEVDENVESEEDTSDMPSDDAEENTDENAELKPTDLGVFKLTAYCACARCCGKSDGITATGTVATQGRTVAVDPSVIPYGSRVIINGHTYVAEDCGGAIKTNRIDIFFDSHQEALNFGVQYAKVYVHV